MRTFLLLVVLLAVAGTRAWAQTASQLYAEGVQTYEVGNADAAKQKLRLALEVDKNFRPAATLLAKIAAGERQAGEVLRYLGSLAGVDFKVEPYAISVVPAVAAPTLAP